MLAAMIISFIQGLIKIATKFILAIAEIGLGGWQVELARVVPQHWWPGATTSCE
jgi:hypothetical protein